MSDGPVSLYVKNDGVLLHTLIYDGDGPDVLLVPGITSPAALWGFVAERLSAFSSVHVMDVRGRGLSDHDPSLPYGERDCAQDVVYMGSRLDRPVIIGHSMGARIGVAAAAQADLFAGLVAVDPPVSGPGRRPYPTPLAPYIDAIRAVSDGGGIEAARMAVPHWSEDHVRRRAAWLPTCSEIAVSQAHRSFHDDSLHELLPAVRCPTLLLYAEHGDVVRESEAEEIVSLLPNGQAHRIAGAGHMIPWDRLDAFVDEVRAFLAEIAR